MGMPTTLLFILGTLISCKSGAEDTASVGSTERPWKGGHITTQAELSSIRGMHPHRGIAHLHSPWSHDACDGDGLPNGAPDEECLADLRIGLCSTAMDFAYLTDHPAYAADQAWDELLLARDNDTLLFDDETGSPHAISIDCDAVDGATITEGHSVLWMPGFEDELMPVGLHQHASADLTEADAIYNEASADSIAAEQAAGGIVFMAHSEGKEIDTLQELVAAGLNGIEIFNLHAMFDPEKRTEDLGLDGTGWITDIQPFTSDDGTAEPDLFFLGVHQEQTVSIEKWDALHQTTSVIGLAGTDAHQNVLPIELRDGDRGDSYRRMMRWFSNILLVDATGAEGQTTPQDLDEALSAGRLYVAFEVLGTPTTVDFHYETDAGDIVEMGSTVTGSGGESMGTLHVACPTLSASSPQGPNSPAIAVSVFRNGELWQEDCGNFAVADAGVYRIRVDIVPHHLEPFLGDDPDPWIKTYPWVYSNPIYVNQ